MFQFNFGNRFGKNYREVPPEGGEEQPRQKKWGRGSGAKHVKKAAAGLGIALIAVFFASSCWMMVCRSIFSMDVPRLRPFLVLPSV